ncbi:uncharacterized protein [Antedon mediterranea]|uniref:uncharacterized protein n=1 Tax=Antedon mediterranea TaxID=105859 RepID=UPI003AF50D1C
MFVGKKTMFDKQSAIINLMLLLQCFTICSSQTMDDQNSCGGRFADQTGVFSSPANGNQYPHDVHCSYIVTVEDGYIIRLTFETFSLEDESDCKYDYVAVYDNSTNTVIGWFCGTTPPPQYTSWGNVITVIFHTDSTVAKEGFSASYVGRNASLPDPCSPNPCLNGGFCHLVSDGSTFICSYQRGCKGDRFSVKSYFSYHKPAYQSTTYSSGGISYDASLAVDGNRDRDFNSGSCSRTVVSRNENPYWYVDLGSIYSIEDIYVYTPYGSYEVSNFGTEVYVIESEDSPLNVNSKCGSIDSDRTLHRVNCDPNKNGRFVFLFQKSSNEISVCEVQVNGIALIPIVTCPSDIVLVGTPSNVTWDPPTVVDDTDLGLIANCTPSSGSLFPAGPTTVTCTATDSDNNTGECNFAVQFIDEDNENPIVICPDRVFSSTSSGAWIYEHDLSVTDNINSDLSATCTPSSLYFPIGSTKVICTAIDRAGNTGSCTFTVNVTYTGDPVLTCPSNIENHSDTDKTIVTWDDPSDQDYNSGMSATCTPPSGSSFNTGSTDVTCYVINSAGEVGICTFIVTVSHIENPNLVCPEDQTRVTTSNQGTVTWNDPSVTDNVDTGLSATCTPPSGSSFNIGSTYITCSAMDTAGNTGICIFKVLVINVVAPIVTCPDNIEEGSGTDAATVTWDDPTVTDNIDTGLSATCTPPSGSSFNIGSTDVTCSAMDTDGKAGSCVFTVTINNDYVPIFTCPGNIEVSGADQATVTWDDPSVSGNVDTGLSATCTPPSGSSFKNGLTTVKCSALDGHNNVGNCEFTVHIVESSTSIPVYLIVIMIIFAIIMFVMSTALLRLYYSSEKNQKIKNSTAMNIATYDDIAMPTGCDNAGFESYMTSTGITDDATVLQDLQHNTGIRLQGTPGQTVYEVIV